MQAGGDNLKSIDGHNHMRLLDTRVRQVETKTADNAQQVNLPQGDFKSVLDNAIHRQQTVHFSKHAHMRLNARQITLTGEQLSRVDEGVNRAMEKGIRDSLVLVDDVALVVNVGSKTVITAINREQDNVFSNIDGAVIV